MMKCFVYMLECRDGSYYSGWTTDIENRLRAHNLGKGSRYTRCRLPVVLVYRESFSSKSSAMKREYALKQLSRKQKKALIEAFTNGTG